MSSVCVSISVKMFLALLLAFTSCPSSWALPVSTTSAMKYLQQYGYLPENSPVSAPLLAEEAATNAIKQFQRFVGLEETGLLDNGTLTEMDMPRCGVKDNIGSGNIARRKRRYALQGSKWRMNNLTYRISKYPSRLKDQPRVEKEVERAFRVWSEAAPLTFTHKKSGHVHIDIRFEEKDHGDGEAFDGPGKTLAHAFFPQFGGDAHFDDEEKWTLDASYGTNLFQVAAHEFGHSLGLSHSDVRSAVMAPMYRRYLPDYSLDPDDVDAIQSLYGSRLTNQSTSPDGTPFTSPSPDTGDAADLCQDAAIDAVTKTEDGSTYVFKGDFYWRILEEGIADGYPRRISDDWGGAPGNLDAALTWSDGKTFFFKGDKYWRFKNRAMDSGYPKTIKSGFEGIPNGLDAAFLWSGNGKTYFLKGDKYWRYESRKEPPVSDQYPRKINSWKGLPDNIDAAFQWENGRTYFFKGQNYYRFNDQTFAVDSGDPSYPRSTSVWWFDCRSMSQEEAQVNTTNTGSFQE